MREVDFTPTGVRAWIEGRVLNVDLPAGAPPGGVVFEATGSGLRIATGAVQTIWGRATMLDGVDDVVIYLEGLSESQ